MAAIGKEEIAELVKKIVKDQLDPPEDKEITLDSHFNNDLNADSLDTVELVMILEEKFGCTIPDEEAEKIKTVGDAVSFIQENMDNSSEKLSG